MAGDAKIKCISNRGDGSSLQLVWRRASWNLVKELCASYIPRVERWAFATLFRVNLVRNGPRVPVDSG